MGTRFGSAYRSTKGFPMRNGAFGCFGCPIVTPATIDAARTLQAYGSSYPPTSYNMPTYEPPVAFVVGQQLFLGTYRKLRLHISFTAPSKKPATAKFKIGLSRASGSGAFTMNLYRATADLRPIDVGDWGNLDTLEDSLDVSTVPADGVTRYYYFNLDVEYLSGAEERTFILVSSRDESNTAPTANEFVYGYAIALEAT